MFAMGLLWHAVGGRLELSTPDLTMDRALLILQEPVTNGSAHLPKSARLPWLAEDQPSLSTILRARDGEPPPAATAQTNNCMLVTCIWKGG